MNVIVIDIESPLQVDVERSIKDDRRRNEPFTIEVSIRTGKTSLVLNMNAYQAATLMRRLEAGLDRTTGVVR